MKRLMIRVVFVVTVIFTTSMTYAGPASFAPSRAARVLAKYMVEKAAHEAAAAMATESAAKAGEVAVADVRGRVLEMALGKLIGGDVEAVADPRLRELGNQVKTEAMALLKSGAVSEAGNASEAAAQKLALQMTDAEIHRLFDKLLTEGYRISTGPIKPGSIHSVSVSPGKLADAFRESLDALEKKAMEAKQEVVKAALETGGQEAADEAASTFDRGLARFTLTNQGVYYNARTARILADYTGQQLVADVRKRYIEKLANGAVDELIKYRPFFPN